MKKISALCLLFFMLFSCSSTRLVNSWKNKEHRLFKPSNILVIGVTPNTESRKIYEQKLVEELNARGINALQSTIVYKSLFKDPKLTEKELEIQLDKLVAKDYDAILVSLVKNVKDLMSYSGNQPKIDYKIRKFVGYFLVSQMDYFDKDDAKDYKVFVIETSLYSLNKDSKKNLVWLGNYEMIDPKESEKTIKKYASTILKSLEKEKIIPKKQRIFNSYN